MINTVPPKQFAKKIVRKARRTMLRKAVKVFTLLLIGGGALGIAGAKIAEHYHYNLQPFLHILNYILLFVAAPTIIALIFAYARAVDKSDEW